MPLTYRLLKTLSVGVTYQSPPDIGYVVKKIGTNASADLKLVVDGRPTGPILSDFAPLHRTSSNKLGPLALGELYYVIPPERKFWLDGPSGAKATLWGDMLKLAPGEAFPGDLLERFRVQDKHYLTYIKGTFAFNTDEAWAADREVTLLELTPKTIEEYRFNSIMMLKVENLASALEEGQIAVRFYLDGVPLDHLTSEPGHLGIDAKYMPYPPNSTDEEEPFSLEKYPITVLGDHTLKITAKNVSGSSLSPASETAITLTLLAIVEYLIKE